MFRQRRHHIYIEIAPIANELASVAIDGADSPCHGVRLAHVCSMLAEVSSHSTDCKSKSS